MGLNKVAVGYVQDDVLRSVRELEKFKVAGVEGAHCGRIKDIYFDDSTWQITQLVLSIEPRQFGQKQVLLAPSQLSTISEESGLISLNIPAAEVEGLPRASSVRPVCKQYDSLAFSSPGGRILQKDFDADPHLRSARSVIVYRVNTADSAAGMLADLVFDDAVWQIRYLAVEQKIDGKRLRYHVLPQSVERFTWSTQRVILRDLKPVRLESGAGDVEIFTAA